MKRCAIALLVLAPLVHMPPVDGQDKAKPRYPFAFSDVGEKLGLFPHLTGIRGHGAGWGDVDGDGWLDLYLTNMEGDDQYYENAAGRTFVRKSRQVFPRTSWGSMGIKVFDFNNDGLKDYFAAAGNALDNAELTSSRASRQRNAVFVNQGDGTFEMQLLGGPAFHRGAAFADFDRDGRVDAVVTRLNEPPLVLRNATPNAGQKPTPASTRGSSSSSVPTNIGTPPSSIIHAV